MCSFLTEINFLLNLGKMRSTIKKKGQNNSLIPAWWNSGSTCHILAWQCYHHWYQWASKHDNKFWWSKQKCFWLRPTKGNLVHWWIYVITVIIIIRNHTGQLFHGNDKRKQYRTALTKRKERNWKFSSNQSHPDK